MKFTGERFTPDCVREIWYEHWHRYLFAARLVAGRRVLDLACGEGYGAHLLAGHADRVIGVDLAEDAVAHAREHYSAANLEFRQGSATDIPLEDDSVDAVVSFETVEHLMEQERMLEEFDRVLAPGGLLIISSPDREVYSEAVGHDNAFHVRELDREEFEALLAPRFPARRLLGQKLLFQSAIWPVEERAERCDWLATRDGDPLTGTAPYRPIYLIAVCARDEDGLPAELGRLSLFGDAEESVYAHYYHEIRKNMAAGGILQERDQEIATLRDRLSKAESRRGWWSRLFRRRKSPEES